MNKLTLYFDFLSQPSRTLYILLSTTKTPFVSKEIALRKGEQKTEEFKKICPMQTLPAISDGDFNLSESVAIVRHLFRERKDLPDHWYPKEGRARARVDEFLEYQHLGLRAQCVLFFTVVWSDPFNTQKAPSVSYAAKLQKEVVRACDRFQEVWLKEKPFICGDKITVADLFAATELEQTKLAGYEPRDGRPALTAWLERVQGETQPHYDTAHFVLNRLTAKYKGQSPALFAKN